MAATAAAASTGTSDRTTNRNTLLRNLCLDAYHCSSSANKKPTNPALNLKASIHFAILASRLDANQELILTAILIHLLPYYCFGRIVGMDDIQIFICFPDLRKYDVESSNTFLSSRDQDLWFDGILLLCLNTAVASSNKK